MDNNLENNLEIELTFTDLTLLETDGVFEEVRKKMSKDNIHDDKWMLRTHTTITSPYGVGEMMLHFFGDKKIAIIEYNPSIGDLFYNPDIQALSTWAQDNGWDAPHPQTMLIKSNKEFWKHFYDVLLIDSEYFDAIYGKRPQLEEENND